MRSLKSMAVMKIPNLNMKSFREILEMCDDENPERASAICDVLFSSRDALFSLFKDYMNSPTLPQATRNRHTTTRKRLLKELWYRQDVQSATQCEQFFKALIRGFKWEYAIIKSLPEEDYIYLRACPQFLDDKRRPSRRFEFYGTIPDEDAIGIDTRVRIEGANLQNFEVFDVETKLPPLFVSEDLNLVTNREIRTFVFTEILNNLSMLLVTRAVDHIVIADTITISRVTIETAELQNMEDSMVFDSVFQIAEPNLAIVKDQIVETLVGLRTYNFAINTAPNRRGALVITLFDTSPDGRITLIITNTVFKIIP